MISVRNLSKMKRLRGFKLGHKLVKAFKWIVRSDRIRPGLTRNHNPVARVFSSLRRGVKRKRICRKDSNSGSGKIRLGKDPKLDRVPKGHLAVYVGESDSETRRVVVPVIYFNHPLFGELLKEAERVYGFDNPGRITIPCRVSDFEKVQMRIAAWDHRRRKRIYGSS